ncbi:MAG: hypothetical protein AAGI38_19905 [Bacteroidota bacterium]
MLKKLVESLKTLARTPQGVDPAIFNDPLALEVEWVPLKGGGANLKTHKLVSKGPGRLEFRVSGGATVFYLIFFVIGVGAMLGATGYYLFQNGFTFNGEDFHRSIMLTIFGLLFGTPGAAMLYFGSMPQVFDKERGYFWRGWKEPNRFGMPEEGPKLLIPLEDIHALQLLAERVSGSKSSFYSYELNLILTSGERVNVVDHGNWRQLQKDTEKIAELIQIPIWDAIPPHARS